MGTWPTVVLAVGVATAVSVPWYLIVRRALRTIDRLLEEILVRGS